MAEELRFAALGGVGEIGMNAYLFGYGESWMLVDLGLGFADDRLPGVDIVLPDPRFLEAEKDRLAGLVLTHAHEDHLGAVPYLWPRLGCPIWCTRFAAAVLRRKFADFGISAGDAVHEVAPRQNFRVGPFRCRFLHVTHSIPESNALVIDTPAGRILHTGDWKLDPAPLLGPPTDSEGLEEVGNARVLAMIGDSTNVLSAGSSGSEAELRDSLMELVAAQPNRVVFTTFSSNIVRMETAILAGVAAGRRPFVIGRSMRRMLEAAREVGYLADLPPLGEEREIMDLPRHRVMALVTGSQGEARSALQRIAQGSHPRLRLERGDTVIFSAKIIPGNERVLFDLHNQLVSQGVEVITEEDHFVHVSGHPCRDELEQMYRWIRPKIAIPVHGEARHLQAHVRFAKRLGAEQVLLVSDGDLVRLAPGPATVIGRIPVGRLAVDGGELVDADDELFRTRRRLAGNGVVSVSVVLDEHGSLLADPRVSVAGVVPPARLERLKGALVEAVAEAIEALDDEAVLEDREVEEAVRVAVRQALDLPRERRPLVETNITRLGPEALARLEDESEGALTR
ncbi:MAG: ribonuclease J [Geminicoccaceae bacterium]|nr:ribonuclease J [Geminicoccaceae bacterium]MCS7268446.1 ribonuclease J [Geminicoccaceae bacterium]MCX7631304.1 ribonuclease J [Geminicoccaceae bacterium]MDW8124902.1 ribonuclease J [Geminicoccaceae bacterium]MDW8340950.1 ribonuclease J [Geminicoccaceae bacterium]